MRTTAPEKTNQNNIQMIKVGELHPHPDNPRKDVGDVSELAESIRAQGVRQNLLVVPNPDGEGYRVVIGHRRLAAARLAGLEEVPCVVDETLDEKRQLELMIVENCQRADLTPIEEADAYQGLLNLGDTAPKIARKTGRSPKYVRSRLRMAAIPEAVRSKSDHFAQLSVSDLEALAEFDDSPKEQVELVEAAGTDSWDYRLKLFRDKRRRRKWEEDAKLEIADLGLKPKKTREPWKADPGLDFPDCIGAYLTKSFAEQWKDWHGHHSDPNPVVKFTEEADGVNYYVYEHLPASQVGENRKKEEEAKQRAAEEHARLKPIREFDATSRELREQWLHSNLHSFTDRQWRLAVTTIFLRFMMHGDPTDFNDGAACIPDHAFIKSYQDIGGCRLDEDGSSFMTDEAWHQLSERQGKNPQYETALALFADWEAEITWMLWKDEDERRTTIRPYYELLAQLGYPVSDAETKALAGEFPKEES